MKLTIDTASLSKALTTSSRSLLARANLPILSNLLISTKQNYVEILSTDLETATKITVACKVGTEGATTVVGRTLLEFVSQLPEGQLTIEKLGEELVFSMQGYGARFATMPAEEFPAIPAIEKGMDLKVGARVFARAIEKVAFGAAQDEGRPILTGVLCEVNKNRLSMVATDGYRLSFEQIELPGKASTMNFKVIVPAKALVEISKIISEKGFSEESGDEQVEITIASALNQLSFATDGGSEGVKVEYSSRLIEGEFPAWQKIIPTSFATNVKISRPEFIKLVKVASIFARESGNIVKIKVEVGSNKKGSVQVASGSSQLGSGDAKSEAVVSGNGGEIAFNWRYLLEVLSVLEEEEVTFEMNESLNPGKITGEAGSPFFHIIMPVRLQG